MTRLRASCAAVTRRVRVFRSRHSHAGLWLARAWCKTRVTRLAALPRSPLALVIAFIAAVTALLAVFSPPPSGCRWVRESQPGRAAAAVCVPAPHGSGPGQP